MAYVDKINKDNIDYDIQDSKAARSVDGSISSHVEEANQIHTSTGVSESSEFIYRTTAGDASISNGMATLSNIKGKTLQTGHVDESIDVHGDFSASGTTVSIEESTWRTYVADSGVYEFEYDGANWKLDDATVTLANYGLTVTGSVSVNDTITVGYTKLEIGTLTTASPTALVSTGFNQYDATAGYAHVIGNNQYRIDGTYTSLGFTTTIGGVTAPVTVTNGKFTPTEDGYIYVSGGSGDILIALVWSGVRDADPFEAYETSVVNIPTEDAEENNLPTATYGMPSVGDVADELNFSEKKYYQKIGHYTYSAENLATVQAMGVDYWYDLNDIFYVLENSVIYDLASSVSGAYEANDFGTEEFIGTSAPLGATIYYGNNLVDKLRNLLDIQSLGPGLSLEGSVLKAIGGSGVKLLTENDYDYPDANPTGVALWRLQPGVYILPLGVKGYTGVWFSADVARTGTWLVTTGAYGSDPAAGLFYFFGGEQVFRYTTRISNGSRLQGETVIGGIRDNLYSNDRAYGLSAYQGKVLDEKIEGRVKQNAGAPTTSTVGTVGMLMEDTTNGKLYICTDATNPYVWEAVGGGGGTSGMKQLTTSDYNWPEDNPDGIAPWLLDLGWYITSDNLKIYPSSMTGSYYTSIYGQIYGIGRGNGMGAGHRFVFNLGSGAGIPATQWSGATYTRWFDDNGVVTNSEYLVGSARLDERISRRVGAPLSSSKGVLGEFWTNKNTGKTYKCVGANDVSGVYDWEEAITNPSGLLINGGTTAPTTATVGQIGTQYTYVDTTGTPTAHLCVCVEIDDTTDPDNPSYTWQTLI